MSRRENASSGGSSSPIAAYYRWHGNGSIEYYNKESKEKEYIDSVNLVVLDIRNSVTGWSEANKSQIRSNMIKDVNKEPLVVKTFNGKEIANGMWKDIKGDVADAEGKYTVNLICLNTATGEVVNLQLSSDNLATWMTFREKNTEAAIYDAVLKVTAGEKKKKGATKWVAPEFNLGKLSAKDDKAAEDASAIVKAYFVSFNPDARVNNAAPEPQRGGSTYQAPAYKQDEEDDDLPF